MLRGARATAKSRTGSSRDVLVVVVAVVVDFRQTGARAVDRGQEEVEGVCLGRKVVCGVELQGSSPKFCGVNRANAWPVTSDGISGLWRIAGSELSQSGFVDCDERLIDGEDDGANVTVNN